MNLVSMVSQRRSKVEAQEFRNQAGALLDRKLDKLLGQGSEVDPDRDRRAAKELVKLLDCQLGDALELIHTRLRREHTASLEHSKDMLLS